MNIVASFVILFLSNCDNVSRIDSHQMAHGIRIQQLAISYSGDVALLSNDNIELVLRRNGNYFDLTKSNGLRSLPVAVSPDGEFIAIQSRRNILSIFSSSSIKEIASLDINVGITKMEWLPSGFNIAILTSNNDFFIVGFDKLRLKKIYSQKRIFPLHFTRKGHDEVLIQTSDSNSNAAGEITRFIRLKCDPGSVSASSLSHDFNNLSMTNIYDWSFGNSLLLRNKTKLSILDSSKFSAPTFEFEFPSLEKAFFLGGSSVMAIEEENVFCCNFITKNCVKLKLHEKDSVDIFAIAGNSKYFVAANTQGKVVYYKLSMCLSGK